MILVHNKKRDPESLIQVQPHRFSTGRGSRPASPEAKLIKHLMAIRKEVLYDISLDIHKFYYTLKRDLCLDILAEYGVILWDIRLLRRYWGQLTMIARAGG